jgi:hypothetical protein
MPSEDFDHCESLVVIGLPLQILKSASSSRVQQQGAKKKGEKGQKEEAEFSPMTAAQSAVCTEDRAEVEFQHVYMDLDLPNSISPQQIQHRTRFAKRFGISQAPQRASFITRDLVRGKDKLAEIKAISYEPKWMLGLNTMWF